MNLYMLLQENSIINEVRDRVLPKVHKAQNLIDVYIIEDDMNQERLKTLTELEEALTEISDDFKNIGYDYTPEVSQDVNEDTFQTTLSRLKEQLAILLNNFEEKIFEATITQLRNTINLIEVHRTNFL